MIDPKFNFKDISTPTGGLIVYTDTYWMCENGDTKKVLFYDDSPQCNSNRLICEAIFDNKMYESMNLQIVFVPVAFVPIRK